MPMSIQIYLPFFGVHLCPHSVEEPRASRTEPLETSTPGVIFKRGRFGGHPQRLWKIVSALSVPWKVENK